MKVFPSFLFAGLTALGIFSSIASEPDERRPPAAIVSHIRRQGVDSSAIFSIGYSKRMHALEIEFVNGAIYRYLDVPIFLYRRLMAVESKARFYDKNIRGRYRSIHVRPRKRK
jgi:KTSC domain